MEARKVISRGSASHEIWQWVIAADSALGVMRQVDRALAALAPEASSILSIEKLDGPNYAVTVVAFQRTTEDPS